LFIQSATQGDDLVILVTPIKNQKVPASLVVEAGILWNREGYTVREGDCLIGVLPNKKVRAYITKETIFAPNIPAQTPYLAAKLTEEIGVSTGRVRSIGEIKEIIEHNKKNHNKRKEEFGDLAEAYNAMQTSLAWNTFYEPSKDRVFTTVSRLWNVNFGGYGIFCWDNYFAAYIASLDSKEIAYSNAIEITKEKTSEGFVPNGAWESGYISLDRSEPPVGSMVVRELYRKFRDKWFLEYLFDDLYEWNTWYITKRGIGNGLLALGSTPYEPIYNCYWETAGVGKTFGGALEAGLDNSPMYDDIPFNHERHTMELADVGLTSLITMDCNALADIADIIGRKKEAQELRNRAAICRAGLETLWDKETGMFLNKRTDTGEFSKRMSPNNFYPLLTGVLENEKVDSMLNKHFFNPEEFYGEWMIPSISRNDPAYKDQSYWRGRIWAPMNLLVYLGLRRNGCQEACRVLAEKSKNLLLKEWLEHGHIHENYNGDTGEGCDVGSSDRFYFWGGLLSMVALMDAGYVEGPEKDL
jgi:putative isomerase